MLKIRFLTAIVFSSLFAGIVASAADSETKLQIKPGDQIVTVDVQNAQQLQSLLDLDLDIWSHEYGVGPIDVHASTKAARH